MKPGKQRRSKAFTLVEFLIVVAVVSLLSIAIIASVDNSTDKAKSTGVMTDIRALETAIHQVGIEQGEFIDDLELLSQQLNKNLDEKLLVHVENNKLVTDATDPWGTEYQLLYSKPAGTFGVLKILSAGKDGSFDTQDDAGIVVSYNKTPNGATINSEEYVYSNDPDNHTCVFDCMVKTSQFVKSVGNCTTPTIYYYSCSCGAVGTETFEGSKNTSTHVSESKYTYEQQNADQHIKVTKCAGCNESITSLSENHSFIVNKCEHCGYEKHVHTYDQQKVEDKYIKTVATCKNAASYYYVCSCGQQGTESYSYGETLQHNYIAEVTKQPTCKAPGIKTHTCSLCGDSYTSGLTQYAHSYTQKIVNSSTLRSDATCTTKATYYYSCSMCNEKGSTDYFESGEISLTNHDKNASTETKYSKYNETQHLVETICKGCNRTKQSTYANHAFNNVTHTCISCEQHVHEYDQKITTSKYEKTQATCTQKAVYYYSCVCEAKGTETFESGDLKAHTFYAQTPDDSKYLKSSATCVAQAVYYRSCTGCGLAGTETFSYGEKNPSNHTGNTKKTYSFMDDDNHTTKTLCSDCNVELKTNTESHEFDNNHTCTLCKNHVHEYNNKGNLRLAQAATCVEKATYYYNCVCNDIGTETYEFGTTDPSNHNNQLIAGKESDCHEKCSQCGETTQDGNYHSYQSSIVTNATCTSKGVRTYTCTCGWSYTAQDVAIDSSNHVGYTTTYIIKDDAQHTIQEECVGCHAIKTSVENHNVVNKECTKCDWYEKVYTLSGEYKFNDTLTQTGWASGDTSKYQLINFDLINGNNILDRNVFEYGVRDMYGCVYLAMHFNGATSGHLYSQYHWSSKSYGGCSITTQSGWHASWSDFIVDFGNEPQIVSKEFYEWFISNTSVYEHVHNYNQTNTDSSHLKTNATCTSKAVYYYSCYCGQNGTETFTSGNVDQTNHLSENLVTTCISISDTQHQTNITCSKCNTVTSSVNNNHNIVDDVCNTCGYASVIYVLSGKWLWNDDAFYDINEEMTIVQSINFTVGNSEYSSMDYERRLYSEDGKSGYINMLYYDSDMVLTFGYVDAIFYEVIDFGSDSQSVSQEFYEWFVTNATEIIETSTFMIYTDSGTKEYQYEPGMTFNDFLNSKYNTGSNQLVLNDNKIIVNNAVNGPYLGSAPNVVKPEYPIDPDAYYAFDFTKNAVTCDKYYINGTWQFNENKLYSIIYDGVNTEGIVQNINFVSNGTEFTKIQTSISLKKIGGNGYLYYVNTDGNVTIRTEVYGPGNSLEQSAQWSNDAYRIIDFGSEPQNVSKEFYEWFTANATQ